MAGWAWSAMQLLEDRAHVDAETLRGAGTVVALDAERSLDQLALAVGDGLAEREPVTLHEVPQRVLDARAIVGRCTRRQLEIVDIDRRSLGQPRGTLDAVLELANVARPVMGDECRECERREVELSWRAVQEEVPRQQLDVGAAQPQWRDSEMHDVEPVQQ